MGACHLAGGAGLRPAGGGGRHGVQRARRNAVTSQQRFGAVVGCQAWPGQSYWSSSQEDWELSSSQDGYYKLFPLQGGESIRVQLYSCVRRGKNLGCIVETL